MNLTSLIDLPVGLIGLTIGLIGSQLVQRKTVLIFKTKSVLLSVHSPIGSDRPIKFGF